MLVRTLIGSVRSDALYHSGSGIFYLFIYFILGSVLLIHTWEMGSITRNVLWGCLSLWYRDPSRIVEVRRKTTRLLSFSSSLLLLLLSIINTVLENIHKRCRMERIRNKCDLPTMIMISVKSLLLIPCLFNRLSNNSPHQSWGLGELVLYHRRRQNDEVVGYPTNRDGQTKVEIGVNLDTLTEVYVTISGHS